MELKRTIGLLVISY